MHALQKMHIDSGSCKSLVQMNSREILWAAQSEASIKCWVMQGGCICFNKEFGQCCWGSADEKITFPFPPCP